MDVRCAAPLTRGAASAASGGLVFVHQSRSRSFLLHGPFHPVPAKPDIPGTNSSPRRNQAGTKALVRIPSHASRKVHATETDWRLHRRLLLLQSQAGDRTGRRQPLHPRRAALRLRSDEEHGVARHPRAPVHECGGPGVLRERVSAHQTGAGNLTPRFPPRTRGSLPPCQGGGRENLTPRSPSAHAPLVRGAALTVACSNPIAC